MKNTKKLELGSTPLILVVLIFVILLAMYLFGGIPNPFVNTSRQESTPLMDESVVKQ